MLGGRISRLNSRKNQKKNTFSAEIAVEKLRKNPNSLAALQNWGSACGRGLRSLRDSKITINKKGYL
jgi:hypothetical protein